MARELLGAGAAAPHTTGGGGAAPPELPLRELSRELRRAHGHRLNKAHMPRADVPPRAVHAPRTRLPSCSVLLRAPLEPVRPMCACAAGTAATLTTFFCSSQRLVPLLAK